MSKPEPKEDVNIIRVWNRYIEGVARIFHVGQRKRYQDILNRSDADAIRGDWINVGKDIQTAMDKYKNSDPED